MIVQPSVKLSTLSPGDTFLLDGDGWLVSAASALPAPNPGCVWATNLVSAGTVQCSDVADVIPVPLKVVNVKNP
jgi:hypothetical protein